MVVARLQGDDCGAALGPVPGRLQCHHLGVRAADRLRSPAPGDLPVTVQDHRADGRIGIGRALDLFGLLDGQPHHGLERHSVRCLEALAACWRRELTAAAGSAALYTAEPATKQSTPASAACSMVSALMP